MSLKGLSDLYVIFLFLDLKIEIERCADPRPSPWELFFLIKFYLGLKSESWKWGENYPLVLVCQGWIS